MPKQPYFDWPIVNSNRVVVTAGPLKDTAQQNFDNTLFANMRIVGGVQQNYWEKFITDDNVRLQWRSSYDANQIKIYNEANTLIDTIDGVKVKSFMNKTDFNPAVLADAGSGKIQAFFTDALLPQFAVVGQDITISGTIYPALNATFTIEEITSGTGPAEGFVALIITEAWPGGAPSTLNCVLAATYDQLPYDVWEATITWTYPAGNYYFVLTATDGALTTTVATSEPIVKSTDVNEMTTPDHVKIEFNNDENSFKLYYDTGIANIVRVMGEVRQGDPGGEETVMEDSDRKLIKLNEYVTRMVDLTIEIIPSYLAERLTLAMGHDNILVNGIAYQKQDKVSIERNPDDDLVNFKVKLRQVNFIAENGDDIGAVIFGLSTDDGTMILTP